jgi:hypothetical protein
VVIRVHRAFCCVVAVHWTDPHVPLLLLEGAVSSFLQAVKSRKDVKDIKTIFFIDHFLLGDKNKIISPFQYGLFMVLW